MSDLTVCIPVYKRLDYLKNLVESIPEDYPICISDNGNYIKEDLFCRGNVRIKHIDDVIPMFSNWNASIDMVETEWFIIPGDDDIIYPEKMDAIMHAIQKYSNCAVIAFGYDIINEVNEKRKGWQPIEDRCFDKVEAFYRIQRHIPYRCPAMVINTAKSRGIGNYDEEFAYTAGDSLFLQHLGLLYPIAEIREIVAGYRMWDNNFTSLKNSSTDWFDQLELWIRKMLKILREQKIVLADEKKFHDQIILDNLLSAFDKQKAIKEKLNLLKYVGWPACSGLKGQLRLVKHLIH